jgi:hypothetical protein
VWPAFAAAVVLSSAVAARAANVFVTPEHYIDYREVGSSGGLEATNGNRLDDLRIDWEIAFDASTAMWTYDYTFHKAGRGSQDAPINYFELQAGEDLTILQILDENNNDITDNFNNNGLNTKMRSGAGGTFDGVKFQRNDPQWADRAFDRLIFTTQHSPTWGDFRVRASSEYAYNTGISTDPTAVPHGLTFNEERTYFIAWLPTPDTIGSVVAHAPAPLATPVALALITGWGLMRRRRHDGRDMN